MMCTCGKECGIRIWCPECEAKAIRQLEVITAELNYKTERFKRKTDKIFKNIGMR